MMTNYQFLGLLGFGVLVIAGFLYGRRVERDSAPLGFALIGVALLATSCNVAIR